MKERVRGLVEQGAHPLLNGRVIPAKTLVVIAASDRGLCGGFNAQLLKQALHFLQSRTESIEVITVGKHAERAARRAGYHIIASFEAISNAPSFERSVPVGTCIAEQFYAGNVDRVFLVSTVFRSALTQVPTVRQLLPMTPEPDMVSVPMSAPRQQRSEEDSSHDDGEDTGVEEELDQQRMNERRDVFEPGPDAVLEELLPRLLEVEVYQALLESAAAEHSARMLAMRNATENASSMLQELTFTFNQARQASITREISEISAGKAAIE